MRPRPLLPTRRGQRAVAVALLLATTGPALAAQEPVIPPGRLDSATVQGLLAAADYAFVDDPVRSHALFGELLRRRADLPPGYEALVAHSFATTRGDWAGAAKAFADLARQRPGPDYEIGLIRNLLTAREFTAARERAAAFRPPAGMPPRPILAEVEGTIAQYTGDVAGMLRAARAYRSAPGQTRSHVAIGIAMRGLAQAGQRRALAALLDTALAVPPSGYRIDPVTIFAGYGDAIGRHGHAALAERAWRRALALLDSTAGRAAERGPGATDSIRLTRGRLLLSLGRAAEARALLAAPSIRRNGRERLRQGWLGVALARLGDGRGARMVERALAADTIDVLRGSRALARAMILEALGEPARAAGVLVAAADVVDPRQVVGSVYLRRTSAQPAVRAFLAGR